MTDLERLGKHVGEVRKVERPMTTDDAIEAWKLRWPNGRTDGPWCTWCDAAMYPAGWGRAAYVCQNPACPPRRVK